MKWSTKGNVDRTPAKLEQATPSTLLPSVRNRPIQTERTLCSSHERAGFGIHRKPMPLCLCGLLDRMFVFPSIGRPFPFAFVRGVTCCGIDADKSNADRLSTGLSELFDLSNQIANDSVNLLDHRLCADGLAQLCCGVLRQGITSRCIGSSLVSTLLLLMWDDVHLRP